MLLCSSLWWAKVVLLWLAFLKWPNRVGNTYKIALNVAIPVKNVRQFNLPSFPILDLFFTYSAFQSHNCCVWNIWNTHDSSISIVFFVFFYLHLLQAKNVIPFQWHRHRGFNNSRASARPGLAVPFSRRLLILALCHLINHVLSKEWVFYLLGPIETTRANIYACASAKSILQWLHVTACVINSNSSS